MFLFACVLFVAATFNGISAEDPEKLVGGADTFIENYPHAVSIRVRGNHFCGGSIISDIHVLTAAHCVQPFDNNPQMKSEITVVTGTSSLRYGGEKHKVVAMRYDPRYQGNPQLVMRHDVAILTLSKPIVFNERQRPARLPTSDIPENTHVVIAAWGSTSFPNGQVSENLQHITLNTLPQEQCATYLRGAITPTEFCTFLAPGSGTCQGDSGSGVMLQDCIVGLVSHGIPCAHGIPDVQTNVYMVLDFIHQTMNNHYSVFE
ncbi:hypothetical protein KM043_004285 [Ampulex compressa]|nr:hypothetical protein KM043_004285 [Ampulex compressa]